MDGRTDERSFPRFRGNSASSDSAGSLRYQPGLGKVNSRGWNRALSDFCCFRRGNNIVVAFLGRAARDLEVEIVCLGSFA